MTHSIKIISDNRLSKTGKNRAQVSTLVHRNIELIARHAASLIALDSELGALAIPAESWQQLITLAHFSQTQKNRLRVLWRYLLNRSFCPEKILYELQGSPSGSAIIKSLEQLGQQDSESL